MFLFVSSVFKNAIIFVVLGLSCRWTLGQTAGSKIWYFGNNAGVDFTKSPPSALTDGQIYTDEGCAAVSDPNGKLFFYTDGRTVYNRTHAQMTNGNGLNGDPSSTQSAVAVADPANSKKFYLFTVDAFAGTKGLCYSVIDMSQSGGLGAVTTKNVKLKYPVSEKITAVRKPYSSVVWVISRGWDNDSFHIFKLDSFGCKFYRSQSIGTVLTGGTGNTAGYLKSNIQGTKIAYATYQGFVESFDFDPVNAIFSNPIKFAGLGNAYGVEFSKSGNLLYICSPSSKKILQADLEAGSPANILASLSTVVNVTGNAAYGLQMGPDGRIYLAIASSDYISCIPKPEIKGNGCGYILKAVDLNGKLCRAGLPNALNSDLFEPISNFTWKVNCAGDVVQFYDTFDFSLDSLIWYFGWNGKTALATSKQSKPQFQFPTLGDYGVKLVAYRKDVRVDSVTHIVTQPDTLRDTIVQVLCYGDSIKIGSQFQKSAGLYVQLLTSYLGCDSFLYHRIGVLPKSGSDLSRSICQGTSFDFYGTQVSSAGLYKKAFKNSSGCDSTIAMTVSVYPKNETVVDASFCAGSSYSFNGKSYTQAGKYQFQYIDKNGCDSSIILNLTKNSEIRNDVYDTFCLHDSFVFYGQELRQPGTYRKVFNTASGCDSAVILHLAWKQCQPAVPCILDFPTAFTPDQNRINDIFIPGISCFITNYHLKIYNRWGGVVFESHDPTFGWDGTYQGNTVQDGIFAWNLDLTAQQGIDPEKHHYSGTVVILK